MTPITVADLLAACVAEGSDPARTVLFVERDIPVPVTEADATFMPDSAGQHQFGFLLGAHHED